LFQNVRHKNYLLVIFAVLHRQIILSVFAVLHRRITLFVFKIFPAKLYLLSIFHDGLPHDSYFVSSFQRNQAAGKRRATNRRCVKWAKVGACLLPGNHDDDDDNGGGVALSKFCIL